ncbi:MAG: DNA repair protein RecN [Bacteroidales bacterium]|nr:DNA repair protein RecN [Bacteroidales bacterium]
MLTRLYIRNYALIDSLDIEFPDNLVVISGETGAGKSILLGALSLILGRKADATALGDASQNCVVEAQFTTADNGETILRRVISPQGRSRSFVNDEPVPLEQLREVSANLVDLHSQFDQALLSSSKYQLSVLDSYAGITSEVQAYSALYDSWQAARRELSETQSRIEHDKGDRDYLEFQLRQLEEAGLKEGELEELELEQKQLASAEDISRELAAVGNAFDSGDDSVDGRLRAAESALERLAGLVPAADSLRERISVARIELKDIEYETSAEACRVKFSPERLQEVDDRLSLLYGLMRKHNVQTLEALITIRDSIASRLDDSSSQEESLQELRQRCAQLEKQCGDAAAALHAAREEASRRFAASLQESVRSLEMPSATFEVSLNPAGTLSRTGSDEVLFLFSANKGRSPKELAKCASGGELSRIMLCLKALMSSYMGLPTVIFDEIDTGVSGSVAYKMGEMIVSMGRNMQVLVITHLPQVASRGDAHYLVEKREGEDGRSHTGIRRIEGAEREREIARMLSGASITDEALANARSLMKDTLF